MPSMKSPSYISIMWNIYCPGVLTSKYIWPLLETFYDLLLNIIIPKNRDWHSSVISDFQSTSSTKKNRNHSKL